MSGLKFQDPPYFSTEAPICNEIIQKNSSLGLESQDAPYFITEAPIWMEKIKKIISGSGIPRSTIF